MLHFNASVQSMQPLSVECGSLYCHLSPKYAMERTPYDFVNLPCAVLCVILHQLALHCIVLIEVGLYWLKWDCTGWSVLITVSDCLEPCTVLSPAVLHDCTLSCNMGLYRVNTTDINKVYLMWHTRWSSWKKIELGTPLDKVTPSGTWRPWRRRLRNQKMKKMTMLRMNHLRLLSTCPGWPRTRGDFPRHTSRGWIAWASANSKDIHARFA